MSNFSPFRVVLVGCGGISRAWMRAIQNFYQDQVQLVGVVDLDETAARKLVEEFELAEAKTGTDLEAILAELQPDLVFNCTIPAAHFLTCRQALEAGCHVLVEKPVAESLTQAAALETISRQAGRKLAVIQNRRFIPRQQVIKELLEAGTIGKLHTICADFFLGPHFGGFREEMQHVLLLDMGIHTFDQARFLADAQPESVFCHEFNPAGSWYAHGASAMAIFTMKEGAVFNYRGSWCAQGGKTNWNAEWRLIGERGTIRWNGGSEMTVEVVDQPATGKGPMDQPRIVEAPACDDHPAQESHAGVIGDFLKAIRNGTPAAAEVQDNLYSLAMVEAAVLSAQQAARVDVGQLIKNALEAAGEVAE